MYAKSTYPKKCPSKGSEQTAPKAPYYYAKESQTLADYDLAPTSFPNLVEEPEPLEDELATSFYPATASFSYRKSDYTDLQNITEESEASADEAPTYTKSTRSKKRPSKGSEKKAPKASRHSTCTSRGKHRFLKIDSNS